MIDAKTNGQRQMSSALAAQCTRITSNCHRVGVR